MPKVKGPKDGKIINASFDGKAKSRFPSLKETKDLVLLSIVGNEYCTGEYLGAIVQQAVATHQNQGEDVVSGKTTFLIADEIYWHNIKGENPLNDNVPALKAQALALGDDYFTKNLTHFLAPLGVSAEEFNQKHIHASTDQKIYAINQLAQDQGKNFEIVRWQTWITQNNSHQQIEKMLPYYDTVEGLKIAIEKTVENFVKRHSEDPDDAALWRRRSQDYLTEESPAVMWLAAGLGYNFIIYPGEVLPPFEATKEYFVVENHVAHISKGQNIKEECNHNEFCLHVEKPNRLVNWLEVNFKRSHPAQATKIKEGAPTFFSRPPNKVLDAKTAESSVTASSQTNDDILISAIMQGTNKVLNSKKENEQVTNPVAEATDLFQGITSAIIQSEQMPDAEKLEFLLWFTDYFFGSIKKGSSYEPIIVEELESDSRLSMG